MSVSSWNGSNACSPAAIVSPRSLEEPADAAMHRRVAAIAGKLAIGWVPGATIRHRP